MTTDTASLHRAFLERLPKPGPGEVLRACPCPNCLTPLRPNDLLDDDGEATGPHVGFCVWCGIKLRHIVPLHVLCSVVGFLWEVQPGQFNPEVAGQLVANVNEWRAERHKEVRT